MQPTRGLPPRPPADSPWSMDTVSEMPAGILKGESTTHHSYCAGASRGRWHCLGTRHLHHSDTETDMVQYTFYVWYAPPALTPERKQHLHFLKLSHWQLDTPLRSDDLPPAPLLALQQAAQSDEMVYIYAANPLTGALVLWRIRRTDLSRPMAPPNVALVSVPLYDDDDDDDTDDDNNRPQLSTLDVVSSSMILLGATDGSSFWVEQTHIPVALHVQKVEPGAPTAGFLMRLLGSSAAGSATYRPHTAPIVSHVPCNSKDCAFLVLDQTGRMVIWTVTRTESHRAWFAPHVVPPILRQALPPDVTHLQVLCAAATRNNKAATTEQQLHVLLYAFMEDNTTTSRLYWARLVAAEDSGYNYEVRRLVWLNRFADPHNDTAVAGLCATDDGMAYAVLTVEPDQNNTLYPPHFIRLASSSSALHGPSTAHTTVVMALDNHNRVHEETVVPPGGGGVVTALPGTLDKDMATHGVVIWDACGKQLRLRWRREAAAAPTTTTPVSAGASSGHHALVVLTQHLQAVFWESYAHPDRAARLSPSLTAAEPADLEYVAVAVAQQLQQRPAHNPLEWHTAFVNLLQQTGIYRSLSSKCRWQLLTAGQQVCVFGLLFRTDTTKMESPWERAQLARLIRPDGVAEWLQSVEESLRNGGGSPAQRQVFVEWFCAAVQEAARYRQEHALEVYDVSPTKLPAVTDVEQVPVWTNKQSLRVIGDRLLEMWRHDLSRAHQKSVEIVCSFILQASSDAFASCPGPETKNTYVQAQRNTFDLLRKVNKKDQLAFELCQTHGFFGGLMQIAMDHERKGDRVTFSLEPLFDSLRNQTDVNSGMPFGRFVLRWHTERGYYGHVLKYGAHVPDDLAMVLHNTPALQPFRWIHAIRKGDYENATTSLLKHDADSTPLPQTVRALACASLANRIVEAESSALKGEAAKRRRLIDRKRELAGAQRELLGEEEAETSKLLPPKQLLELALRAVDQKGDASEKASVCFVGLAICSALEESEAAVDGAVAVWCKVITADLEMWKKWLHTETNLADSRLRDVVLQNTAFGLLLDQTRELDSQDWENVVFQAPVVEKRVLAALDPEGRSGMNRLLRSVAHSQMQITPTP